MDIFLAILPYVLPFVFVIFMVAGIGDTYTRFTKGKKLDSKIMAVMPSGIALVYFFVAWVAGYLKWFPDFPGWRGWMVWFLVSVFVGLVQNFIYDRYLYRIFSKDVTDKIAAGIAEKVTEKVTGKDETVDVTQEGNPEEKKDGT